MRIGVDCHVVDGKFQGSRSYILGLFEAAIRLYPEITFVLFAGDKRNLTNVSPTFSFSNVEHVVLPDSGRASRYLYHLGKLAKQHRLDAIHTQYFMPEWIACRRYVTIHDVLWKDFPQFFLQRSALILNLMSGRAARRADHVFTVSNYSKSRIQHYFGTPEERLTVMWTGVNRERFSSEVQEGDDTILGEYGLQSQQYLLSVGRLEPRKNIAALVRAYLAVPNAPKLVIVGQPDFRFRETLQVIQEAGDRIRLLSSVGDSALPVLYRHARAFLFTPLAEGFGAPPIEALSSGCPVLASEATAIPEVVGRFGAYCDPTSLDSIADGIRRILALPRDHWNGPDLDQHLRFFHWDPLARLVCDAYIADLSAKLR